MRGQDEHPGVPVSFGDIFDAISDGFALVEAVVGESGEVEDFRIAETNRSLASMTGSRPNQLVGRRVLDLVPESAQVSTAILFDVLETGEARRFEHYLSWLDKHIEGVAFRPRPGHVALIVSDATKRKRMEAQVRLAVKMEAVGALAGGVAHEVNNPINVIMNYAELMPRFAGDAGKLEEFSGEILSECRRVADIVRDLVLLARREAAGHQPESLCEVVESATNLMARVLHKDTIELVVDVPSDLPPVYCQPQQLQQVLVNLLDNSRNALNHKYSVRHASKQAEITARTVEYGAATWVRLTVKDYGTGIAPENIERVFEPYFSTNLDSVSTGLGLTVCRAIIEEHRGSLSVKSEHGQWTAVDIDLRTDLDLESGPVIRG